MRTMKWLMVTGLVVVLLAGGGCQNWKQMYLDRDAEYKNLEPLYQDAVAANQQCQNNMGQMETQVQGLRRDLSAAQQKATATAAKKPAGRKTVVATVKGSSFYSGRAKLKADAKNELKKIAGTIKSQYGNVEVFVIGHTDTDPIKKSGWKDNWELSTERALAVTRYLISRGVSEAKLVAGGCGEYRPLGSDKSRNRRVEIVVYK